MPWIVPKPGSLPQHRQSAIVMHLFLGTAKLLSLAMAKCLRQSAYLERACVVPILSVHVINLHGHARIRAYLQSNQTANKASELCNMSTTAELRTRRFQRLALKMAGLRDTICSTAQNAFSLQGIYNLILTAQIHHEDAEYDGLQDSG